jgi:hypothetical protein
MSAGPASTEAKGLISRPGHALPSTIGVSVILQWNRRSRRENAVDVVEIVA